MKEGVVKGGGQDKWLGEGRGGRDEREGWVIKENSLEEWIRELGRKEE